MKGIILQSVARAPLILGVPKEVFFGLGGILGFSISMNFHITGFCFIITLYICALISAQKDPFFMNVFLSVLQQRAPLKTPFSNSVLFERYYNA